MTDLSRPFPAITLAFLLQTPVWTVPVVSTGVGGQTSSFQGVIRPQPEAELVKNQRWVGSWSWRNEADVCLESVVMAEIWLHSPEPPGSAGPGPESDCVQMEDGAGRSERWPGRQLRLLRGSIPEEVSSK